MKVITENLAIATIVALSLSIYRTITYYEVFNVDILTYLDASEIFQLQFLYLFVIGAIIINGAILVAAIYFGNDFKTNRKNLEFVSEDGKIKIGYHLVISYGLAIVMMMFFLGFRTSAGNARIIISGEHEREVTLILEDDYIVTDSVNIFAGKTKNYIFFYNINKKQTRVFRVDDVKEIRYMKGINYRKGKRGFWDKILI